MFFVSTRAEKLTTNTVKTMYMRVFRLVGNKMTVKCPGVFELCCLDTDRPPAPGR